MTQGVECPECGGMKTKVQQSNLDVLGNRVRTRYCVDCEHLFATVEVAVPGLSFPRTQRSRSDSALVAVPEHVTVTRLPNAVTVRVVKRTLRDSCRRGHPWTEENSYLSPSGKRTCRRCRLVNARERYHYARAKAPPVILEEQREKWRAAWRRRRAA